MYTMFVFDTASLETRTIPIDHIPDFSQDVNYVWVKVLDAFGVDSTPEDVGDDLVDFNIVAIVEGEHENLFHN
jgi:hypothetical protein